MFIRLILLFLCVCCLIHLIRGQSEESDYENDEDDEFAPMKNDKDLKMDIKDELSNDSYSQLEDESANYATDA